MKHHYDIVIVGAGLVGATLAALLGRSDVAGKLSIAVLDAGSAPQDPRPSGVFDPRVVAVTPQSQQLLADVGIWDEIVDSAAPSHRACPYTRMVVWDGEGSGHIEFSAAEMHRENLGCIVENSLIISLLTEVLSQCPQIDMHWQTGVEALELGLEVGAELGDSQKLVLKSGETLTADLILAVDGANSLLRRLADIPTREWSYGQQAIVTTVTTAQSHQFTAWQRFMHSGPLAFLPLLGADGEDHHSSIVWSIDEDRADRLMSLDDHEFAAALGESFEHRLGDIVEVARRFAFPLHQRHAKTYIKQGLALVGDAAHSIHPLAGQGVNLGLQDAMAMTTEIERALARNIPLSDYSILRRYQRARLGDNLSMMALMEGFKQLYGSPQPWAHVLRNLGMSRVNQLPLLKNALAQRAMGLQGA